MKVILSVLSICFAVIMSSCKAKEAKPVSPSKIENTSTEKKSGFTKGIILNKSQTDGCQFIISINDSTSFEPLNLAKEFQEDGLSISFKYRLSRAMTTCMMGQPISITEIKRN